MQGGGEGPRGLVHMAPSQLTSGPSSSFMRLVPRAGRRAGREELALGHLVTGERRESGEVWVPRAGAEHGVLGRRWRCVRARAQVHTGMQWVCAPV